MMPRVVFLALICLGLGLCAPTSGSGDVAPGAFLWESFDEGWDARWIHSSNAKYDGKFKVGSGELQVPEKNKHYGLTALIPSAPLAPEGGLVVQYEAKYGEAANCGGSYIKLLTYDSEFDAHELVDTTPYSIMFGPDKCGDAKIHLILRHRNPINGTVSEKHLKPNPKPITDTLPHVYTLVLNPDNSFEVLVDGSVVSSGSLLETLEPPVNPPRELPDPADKKPKGWVDDDTIPDPEAKQPEDWDTREVLPDESAVKPKGWLDDEPARIADPAAKKPAGWDDDEDGEWEAPMITNPKCKKAGCGEWKRPVKPNPEYKGVWRAPRIENPNFKGPWVQKTIPNPGFYEDATPLKSIGNIGAVAFELWTIDEGYTFDNLYVGKDPKEAASLREKLWKPKFAAQKKAADDKAKAKDAELEKKKQESLLKAQKAGSGLATGFLKMFDEGALKAAKPYVGPYLDIIRRTPEAIYVVLASPLLLIVVVAAIKMSKAPRVVSDANDKKHDVTSPDDEPAAEEEPAEEEEQEEEADEPVAETKAAAAAAAPSKDEITPQEEEEEPQAPTRRRTRRAA